MAYRVSTEVNAIFEGNTYPYSYDILTYNRQFPSLPYNYYLDYTEGGGVGVPISHAVNDLTRALGVNPFTISKVYCTNGDKTFGDLDSKIIRMLNETGCNYEYMAGSNPGSTFKFKSKTSGTVLPKYNGGPAPIRFTNSLDLYGAPGVNLTFRTADANALTGILWLFPSVAFDPATGFDPEFIDPSYCQTYAFTIAVSETAQHHLICSSLNISIGTVNNLSYAVAALNDIYDELIDDGAITGYDSNNPYGAVVSITGGGNGDPYMDVDTSEKIPFPELPSLSAVNAGLITMYNPSLSQLQSLAAFLWSQPFDIDSFKKLFSNPMDAIIGLGIIPVQPSLSGSRTVKFGNVDSEVSMPVLSSQFVEFDCGSVMIDKWLDCFMDYDPYTKIQIYCPFSGIHSLSVDDIMGKTITLKYHIDCLTGGCAIMLYVSDKGVVYQWNGCCLANIPLTAINYSSAIQNAISAAISVGAIGIGAATGAAPLTFAGGASLASNAANMALNSKPNFERSGNMGGAAGLLSIQTPYLIIERPNISVPDKLNKFVGNTSNITFNLANLTGFTMVDYINLDGIPCTASERSELKSILKEGVIF